LKFSNIFIADAALSSIDILQSSKVELQSIYLIGRSRFSANDGNQNIAAIFLPNFDGLSLKDIYFFNYDSN